MPIKGSFANDKSLNPLVIEAMCRATTEESATELKKSVQVNTPVKTGELIESVEELPVTKPYPNHYKSGAKSDAPHAAHVEFGTAPHIIRAQEGSGLAFDGKVVSEVHHPGTEGRHMFQIGAEEFEATKAEAIARKNAEKFLT